MSIVVLLGAVSLLGYVLALLVGLRRRAVSRRKAQIVTSPVRARREPPVEGDRFTQHQAERIGGARARLFEALDKETGQATAEPAPPPPVAEFVEDASNVVTLNAADRTRSATR